MSITTKAEATEVTLPAVTMTTGYTTSKCLIMLLIFLAYFLFFPLRVYFLFYFYFYGLSICIDKCEHTLNIQNVNFDCLDELLFNNNKCMFKIINPIRTIMSSMSLHHQLLSSLVRTIISPELY